MQYLGEKGYKKRQELIARMRCDKVRKEGDEHEGIIA